MQVAVLRETAPGERRVALAPDHAARLVGAGHAVRVERCAGAEAGFTDEAYRAAGAVPGDAGATLDGATLLVCVRAPSLEVAERLQAGALLLGLLDPAGARPLLERLAARGVDALALERVPRLARTQAMDALSSQASLAGYKAVLLGAAALPRLLPMMSTAAGTLPPARVLAVGAGVAGLQALATARRLGAVTSAFDVRPAAREEVQSLGAAFVGPEGLAAADAGGYARQLDEGERGRALAALAAHLPAVDLVVASAAVPGRPAPRLLTAAMVASMRWGAVVVDLAAGAGGNCELTRPDEAVTAHGVTVLGPTHLAATLPAHASLAYGRNLLALLAHLCGQGGAPSLDPADAVTGPMLVVHRGEVRSP